MRIGVSTGQSGQLARLAAVTAVARAAEQLGYSTVWARDRPPQFRSPGPTGCAAKLDPVLDPVVVLSTTAAITTRVRLGAGFEVTTAGSPVALARALATLDMLSDGRLTVSLGAGSLGLRSLGSGGPIDHTLDAIEAAWAEGASGPVPRPRLPLLLVAGNRAELDRVARRADGWSPDGVPVERLGPMWAELCDLVAAHGRDPGTLQLVVRADVVLTDRPVDGRRPAFHGTAEQVADDVDAVRRAGAHEVVLGLGGDLSLDQLLDGYARVAEAADVRAGAGATTR